MFNFRKPQTVGGQIRNEIDVQKLDVDKAQKELVGSRDRLPKLLEQLTKAKSVSQEALDFEVSL